MVFGPIPSRRLGRSLGINNIPSKHCTYSCVYCQVGRTRRMQVRREHFHSVTEIVETVKRKLDALSAAGEAVDYLTFVPDGEPTLDAGLGREIEQLRSLGIRIAVITNGSLLWREDVRADVRNADWVSLKIDGTSSAWRRINRPYRGLELERILDGMYAFACAYEGTLVTETMLVKGVNDSDEEIKRIAGIVRWFHPATAYVLTPIRPPAEEWVEPAEGNTLARTQRIFREIVPRVEILNEHEENAFVCAGDIEEELLALTSVHPLRREALHNLLARSDADWSLIERLVQEGRIRKTEYAGVPFFVGQFSNADS